MAGNNSIRILRGNSQNIVDAAANNVELLEGQPIYYTDKNYLAVGSNGNTSLTKAPIACRQLIGYEGDTDNLIGNSTTEVASVKISGANIEVNGANTSISAVSQVTVGAESIKFLGQYANIGTYSFSVSSALTSINGLLDVNSPSYANIRGSSFANITSDNIVQISAPNQISINVNATSGTFSLNAVNGTGYVSANNLNVLGNSSLNLAYRGSAYFRNMVSSNIVYIPNKNGTLALTSDIPSINYTLNTNGTVNLTIS